MHQTLYLPPDKPSQPPEIRVINHKEDFVLNDAIVTKISSKQEKTDYLRLKFFETILKNTDKMPAGIHDKILTVWNRIEDNAARNQAFDIDFLFEIYQEYIDYCFHIETKPHSSIILALFFQRVSGPVGSVEKSADFAYRDLKDSFNCNLATCCKTKRLILSLKTLEIKDDFEESVYRDLNLAHLGYDYGTFIRFQNRLEKQAPSMGLTKEETFLCKKAINTKLLSFPSLFLHQYFARKYGAQADKNLNYYKHVLNAKIIALSAGEEQKLDKDLEEIKRELELEQESEDENSAIRAALTKITITDISGEEIKTEPPDPKIVENDNIIDIDAEIIEDLGLPDISADSLK